MIRKTFDVKVEAKNENGGRITISTAATDRDKDHVFPMGARVASYMANPVVQYGHNYREPWATVGRTSSLEITPEGIVADFELRPAANEYDPQNIVRLLWEGNWIRTASIGFNPVTRVENDLGGLDYTEWDLLEWSLVPVPANQDALRLAVKGLEESVVETQKPYPNEHACRLRDPDDFQAGSFRRISRESDGKEYHVIMGRLAGEDAMTEQAYRYPKDTWEVGEAKTHCNAHDGISFEPAENEERVIEEAPEPTEQEEHQPDETPKTEELDAPLDNVPEELLESINEYLEALREQLQEQGVINNERQS